MQISGLFPSPWQRCSAGHPPWGPDTHQDLPLPLVAPELLESGSAARLEERGQDGRDGLHLLVCL